MKRLFVAFMSPGGGVGNCVIDERDPPSSTEDIGAIQQEIRSQIAAGGEDVGAIIIIGFQPLVDQDALRRAREAEERKQALRDYEDRIAARSHSVRLKPR